MQYNQWLNANKESLYRKYLTEKKYKIQAFELFTRIEYDAYSERNFRPRYTVTIDNNTVVRDSAIACMILAPQLAKHTNSTVEIKKRRVQC